MDAFERFKRVAKFTNNKDYLAMTDVFEQLAQQVAKEPLNEQAVKDLEATNSIIELIVESDRFVMTEQTMEDR